MAQATQPFRIVTLDDGKQIMINEAHVVSATPNEERHAIVRMSNGDELVVIEPDYDDWEYDAHTRKY